MKAPSIVTLTMNPAVDLSAAVDRVVADRKLRCGEPVREAGGGGINVARAVRRLGGEALALFPAGGPAGDLLKELLFGEGVPFVAIRTDGWTRENVNVSERETGKQFRFVLPGPSLEAAEWERCLETLSELEPFPRLLVVSGSLPPGVPPDFYARVARLVRSAGSRMILDTSGEPLRLAAQAGRLPSEAEPAGIRGADGNLARGPGGAGGPRARAHPRRMLRGARALARRRGRPVGQRERGGMDAGSGRDRREQRRSRRQPGGRDRPRALAGKAGAGSRAPRPRGGDGLRDDAGNGALPARGRRAPGPGDPRFRARRTDGCECITPPAARLR